MFERVKHGVRFAVLALSFLGHAMSPEHVRACSCVATTFEEAAAESAAIFEGRVEAIEISGTEARVHFRVTQAWRGVEHETVPVAMPSSSAACAFPFHEGVVYLVYAREEGGRLHTSLCSRTAPMDDERAEGDRQALGSGTIPVDVEDSEIAPPPARVPASRAGCASCMAQRASARPSHIAWAALGLGFIAQRSRRKRA